jgi:isopropylmalate/homocitrate/citramalate synthase
MPLINERENSMNPVKVSRVQLVTDEMRLSAKFSAGVRRIESDIATRSKTNTKKSIRALRQKLLRKPSEHTVETVTICDTVGHIAPWGVTSLVHYVREVVAVVRLARELHIPIVPYGGGSGVCGIGIA